MIERIVLKVHRLTISLLVGIGLLTTALGFQRPEGGRAAGVTIISPEGRSQLPVTVIGGREMLALGDLAARFDLQVQEDALAGGLTVVHGGQTIVLAPDQALASVEGRLVSLPTPASRGPNGWLVPVEFLSRALALVYEQPLDFRPTSDLLIVGDLRVPRVLVRHESVGSEARLVIHTSPATPAVVSHEADRLVVRFEADALDATVPPVPTGALIEDVVLDQPSMSVAVRLGSGFGSYRTSETAEAGGASRLTIQILPQAAASAAGREPAAPEPPSPSPLLGRRAGPMLQTIVIDPGHGGDDLGARGPSGEREKAVTLGVARRLKALVEGRLGVRVLLTRDGDDTVRLDERASVANNNKADLFLSLHANASPNPSVSGAEVFYLSLREYDAEGRAGSPEAPLLPVFGGGMRAIEMVQWEMAQLSHLGASAVLAQTVEEELRGQVPMSERALQQAPFRVLVGANMPAVLVEMGFMTNADQEAALASGEFQGRLAQAFFDSIVRFRTYLENQGNLLSIGADRAPTAVEPVAGRAP